MRRYIDDPNFALTVAVHNGEAHVVRPTSEGWAKLTTQPAHFIREYYIYLFELLELQEIGGLPQRGAELILTVNDEVLGPDFCTGALCPVVGRYTTKRDLQTGTVSPEVIIPGWDYSYCECCGRSSKCVCSVHAVPGVVCVSVWRPHTCDATAHASLRCA
jgi:hypothetical protein